MWIFRGDPALFSQEKVLDRVSMFAALTWVCFLRSRVYALRACLCSLRSRALLAIALGEGKSMFAALTWVCSLRSRAYARYLSRDRLLIIAALLVFNVPAFSQVGLGYTVGVGLYEQFDNPDDPEITDDGPVNAALFNVHVGPKIWLGGEKFSFSMEAQVNYAPFAFDYSDKKGVGAFSVPLMAQLQFGGLSGLSVDGGFGFSLGGGVEYALTDLYLRGDEYEDLNRELYRVYIGQAAVGFGVSGTSVQLYGRYGKNEDGASIFSIGLAIDETLTDYERKRPYGQ